MKKELIKYLYENKNGLKSDFILKYSEEDFKSLMYANLLIPCQRSNGEASWKISKECYDLYLTMNPHLQYKSFLTKCIDFFNSFILKSDKKEFLKNQKIKNQYFNKN